MNEELEGANEQEVAEPVNVEQAQEETSVNTPEVAEPVEQKPAQTSEDNSRFAEVRRNAEREARDNLIKEMYGESHGITTYEQYQEAVERQRQEEIRQKIVDSGYDPDLIDEQIANHPVVKKAKEILTKQEQEEQSKADAIAFFDAYPDVKVEDIPPEVIDQAKQGKPLLDAYQAYENKQLKGEIEKLKSTLDIRETNNKNAQSSTGSVTGQDNPPTVTFTREQVDAMSQAEVNKNYDAIMKSQKYWK